MALQLRFLNRDQSRAEARSCSLNRALQERFLNRESGRASRRAPAYNHAACLNDSISEPSSAAFGLTSQNFGRNVR